MSARTCRFVQLLALAMSCVAGTALAATGWTGLAPGIVGSVDHSRFYAAGPDARVMRVSTGSGVVAPLGAERGYPLALVDANLLVLGLPDQYGEARLVLVDASTGEVRARVTVALPPEVSANPLPSPKRSFHARATGDAAALRIDWSFEQRALRGAVIHDAEGQGTLVDPDLVERSGAFVVTLGESTMSVRFTREDEPPPPALPVDLGADERLAGIEGPQFRSADNASVLSSSAEPDVALGTVYRWDLRARDDGNSLGELTVPYSLAPFVVADEVVIYRINPVMRLRADGSREEHGSRLIAFDLAEGRERWSIPVAEREWFGPLPP
jgi:hypothetical protein